MKRDPYSYDAHVIKGYKIDTKVAGLLPDYSANGHVVVEGLTRSSYGPI